ncbi:hypothetical protein GQ53DRAFT_806091 [Thozetella sp. PMI_491]|nr:hypothetical protein GQ53DRAFT_806091 [Thozetella sp. PMI_491]
MGLIGACVQPHFCLTGRGQLSGSPLAQNGAPADPIPSTQARYTAQRSEKESRMANAGLDRRVYRLQFLPRHIDRLAATELLARAIDDGRVTASDIKIFSLADAIESFSRWPTQVATLMFSRTPDVVAQGTKTSWKFDAPGLFRPLVLDQHFHGFTPLNSVGEAQHACDCIAVSGLGSHPLGSWQPRGDDKSFMWVRDVLPVSFPDTRFILYGYDTTLRNSRSVQSVVDLAQAFIGALEADGWASPSAKPLLFLAHSLGGVLLKQLFVSLANGDERANFMLSIIRGAVFFGVPSVGMSISHLLAMVEGQPNSALVETLSIGSQYLENLEIQFDGISYLWGRKSFFWAYETQATPTVVRGDDGCFTRSGPASVMVDRQSATSGRWTTDRELTIQIDEDHSNMVKFPLGDHRTPIIVRKIRQISRIEGVAADGPDEADPSSGANQIEGGSPSPAEANPSGSGLWPVDSSNQAELLHWDYDLMLESLMPPEQDARFAQIEHNFGSTFRWAYEDTSIGLTQWLRKGEGIFWISGKPGSGKSTFMKSLLNNNQTTELMHFWQNPSQQLVATFFFHHRGTLLQKSFEGLLRGLLGQLLKADRRLCKLFDDILQANVQAQQFQKRLGTLDSDIHTFFTIPKPNLASKTSGLVFSKQVERIQKQVRKLEQLLNTLLESRNWITLLNRVFKDFFAGMSKIHVLKMKRLILEITRDFGNKGSNKSQWSVLKDKLVSAVRRVLGTSEPASLGLAAINTWVEQTDLEHTLDQFLMQHDVLPERPKEAARRLLVSRQAAREELRVQIHLEAWSRYTMELGLRNIIDQNQFDLDICLFFDALDEYDGRPEVIAGFLKDLVQDSPTSKTRMRVLFSSRPWPVFRDEFGACPGFKMHEHTQEDIREYCTGSIPKNPRARALLLPMVEEVSRRSRGVFLWVKLVMRDLSLIATDGKSKSADLVAQLQQCLESVPDELDDYYAAIIQRLPVSTRTDTYILLECISRADEPLALSHLPFLISQGRSQKYEGYARTKKLLHYSELDTYLRTISGGLVDVGRDSQMQLMHQTCKDWIRSPTFKLNVLGDLASTTLENGHSYLAKFYADFALHQFRYHVLEAERTTGVSQYGFLSELPKDRYLIASSTITSPKALATRVRLFLFLKDAISSSQNLITFSSEPLISASFEIGTRDDSARVASQNEVLEMAMFLVQHGFQIQLDTDGIWRLVRSIWNSTDREMAEKYAEVVSIGLQNCQEPGVFINYFRDNAAQQPILHFSIPTLAQALLERGMPANLRNQWDETPLDFFLNPLHGKLEINWKYHLACLLVQHGGTLSQASHRQWEDLLMEFSNLGYDIRPLYKLPARLEPAIAAEQPSASIETSLRKNVHKLFKLTRRKKS